MVDDDLSAGFLSALAATGAVADNVIIAAVDSAACGNNCFRIWNGVGDGVRRKKPFFVDDTDADEVDDDGVVIICGGNESLCCLASSIFTPSRVPVLTKENCDRYKNSFSNRTKTVYECQQRNVCVWI